MDMSLEAYKSVRPICRRTQTHVSITRRRGLPFFINRYKKRRFVLFAAAAVLFILWYTSGHIMGITVFGNSRISTETILENLARSGIALGKTTDNIDSRQIRNRMMSDIDDLAWIGINVSGSRIYVEVVERLERKNPIDFSTPCNLVADKDGIIDSIEAGNGQVMVKKDSGVMEGDVLVSGIMDAGEGGFRYVHSYGEVYAKTRYSISREYPLEYQKHTDTGQAVTRRTVCILGKSFPLYFDKKEPYSVYELEETEKEYRPPTDRLPSVKINTKIYKEQTVHTCMRTQAEILNSMPAELEETLKASLPEDAEIKDREITSTLTERGTVCVNLTLICRENIARESEIESAE